ncbi:MAG: helix-turn-helix domain-containing protein [Chloroflexi bacterium]|nr:MAG: helix-turn-helix domain-containing protein [Chloroflexota bacterium]
MLEWCGSSMLSTPATQSLGERIKVRRTELGLSLRELAAQTNLTASFLSQIERDLTSPSLDSLRRISQALEVPIFYFLIEPRDPQPVVRKEERTIISRPAAGMTLELLTPDVNRRMEAMLTQVEGADVEIPLSYQPHTEEFLWVLEGELEVGLGADSYLLRAGDSIYFQGGLLRYLRTRHVSPTRYLSVITPPAV